MWNKTSRLFLLLKCTMQVNCWWARMTWELPRAMPIIAKIMAFSLSESHNIFNAAIHLQILAYTQYTNESLRDAFTSDQFSLLCTISEFCLSLLVRIIVALKSSWSIHVNFNVKQLQCDLDGHNDVKRTLGKRLVKNVITFRKHELKCAKRSVQ